MIFAVSFYSIVCWVGQFLLWASAVIALILLVVCGISFLCTREGSDFEAFAGAVCLAGSIGLILWVVDGDVIANWFYRSPGMFGKDIGGYEERYLDEMYPKVDGAPGWRGRYRYEDGRYIVPIKVEKPIEHFDEYKLHLLPVSKRSFLLSANRFYESKEDCMRSYKEIRAILCKKYGTPNEETKFTCGYNAGDRKIGLVATDILFRPQLYINVYRVDLFEKKLPEELREYTRILENDRAKVTTDRENRLKDSL